MAEFSWACEPNTGRIPEVMAKDTSAVEWTMRRMTAAELAARSNHSTEDPA